MELSRLTIGRRAVWEAIDQWPALQSAFRSKYRGELPDAGFRPLEPLSLRDGPTAPAELPAIAIAPATNDTEWLWGQMGSCDYALAVTIYTPGWEWTLAEWLWEQCVLAICRSKPSATSHKTYISRPLNEGGTGHHPTILPSRFTRTRLQTRADNEEDRPKILAHTFGVGLKLNLQLITSPPNG